MKRPEVLWFCHRCHGPAVKAVKVDRDIEERCDEYFKKMEKRFKDLEMKLEGKAEKTDVTAISLKVEDLRKVVEDTTSKEQITALELEVQEIKEQRSVGAEGIKKLVEDQIYQQKERDRRQSNIIVYGVDESKKEAPKERFSEDKETVAEFMEKELNVKAKIITCFRMGKKKPATEDQIEQDIRPLKVVLSDPKEKVEITKAARKKKEANGQMKYKVSGDFIKEDRESYKKLREELERRVVDGETGLMIRRGKIVKKR